MSIKTKCVNCGRTYIHYNDLCPACRKAEQNPFDVLAELDAIDIDREHDIIHKEIAEQDHRDFPRENRTRKSRKPARLTSGEYRRLQRRQDKETIKRFKQRNERKVIDVTGLG